MRLRSKPELAALLALAYGPFLLSSPGRVSADSKQDLYLDPGAFLSRAADLWDPHVGAGTVPHQNLGYLFPTGPWFWVWERLGVPDWVAQRLWLGTIALAAVLGARWLFAQLGAGRAGALAGAVVYVLTPYQLAFTARMSVLLLPWAALPWLVGLTMRATRTSGWRAPALFAVVLACAGGINASALVFVGVAPLLWVACEAARGGPSARVAAVGALKIGALSLGISLWWIAGLRVQGRYGLPVLQLTENLRTVAVDSTPSDVLRGLGNWFFYGRDRVGYSVDQAADYAGASSLVVALSYVVPMLALALAFLVRWDHRRYFVLLVVVGAVIAVGAWPYDAPSPYGSVWRELANSTSWGLALRNSPRIVPLIVLGFAGLIAGAVGALRPVRWRGPAAVAMVAAAAGGLLPVWQGGFLTEGMQRPEDVPAYWLEAATALDAGDHATRVLEVPGTAFAAYEWGTTIDPITPGLIDRHYLAREVLPSGTRGTVNLLDAVDRRMQLGILEPRTIAPVARLFGVGTIVLRGDLDRSGRFDTPDPVTTWNALRAAPGLGRPQAFGPTVGGAADGPLPSVGVVEVTEPVAIVRTAGSHGSVVLAGDGDGIVDAAGAGLLDGTALVLQSAALDDAALAMALDEGAHLILTDSNRKRSQTWFYALRDTRGETEPVGWAAPDPTGYDVRLDPFPGSTDAVRSVVEQIGGTVRATDAGGPERPEDRAAHAVDGNPGTAWRVAAGAAPGASIHIVPDSPVSTGELRLLQPAGGPSITRVRVEVPGNDAVEVDLDATSRSAAGQAIRVPSGEVRRVAVTILATSEAGGPGVRVGLTEIRVGDLRISETVRLPVDLLTRAGASSHALGLDVVLTRLRSNVPDSGRQDDEAQIDRMVTLPTARSFALFGAARAPAGVSAGLGDPTDCRTDLLQIDGLTVPIRVTGAGPVAELEACGPVTLTAGSHRISARPGADTGIDVDRLVLTSAPGGRPSPVSPRGESGAASEVTMVDDDGTSLEVAVRTDGRPFWFVLGESSSDGWVLTVEGAEVGDRQMVDGYANGWRISPADPGQLGVALRWVPQRTVSVSLVISAVVALLCIGVALGLRRRGAPALATAAAGAGALAAEPRLVARAELRARRSAGRSLRVAVATVVVGVVIAAPAVGVLAGGIVAAASLTRARPLLLAVAAPAALLASRVLQRPSLAWVAVLLLVAELLWDAAGDAAGDAAEDEAEDAALPPRVRGAGPVSPTDER